MARDRAARPEARPLRLFVAVDIPSEVRSSLAAAVEPLRAVVPGARWTPPENWHVTMKFLGGVYPRLRQWVGERAAAAASGVAGFETRLTRLGAFPGPRRARVLWVGLGDAAGSFSALAAALERELAVEFPAEKRPFTAHLTVARFKEQASLPEGVLSATIPGEPFRVEALTLYRSHLGRPAARYEPLARFPLGG